jgi:DoxX-like family
MLSRKTIYFVLNFCIAAIWLINGLWCKLLGYVPRHQEIVSNILGHQNARLITMLIGLSEIGMALWILSGFRSKENAVLQIAIIALMNTLEFILVPDLLLWGRFNSVFALLLIAVIYYNAFHNKPLATKK